MPAKWCDISVSLLLSWVKKASVPMRLGENLGKGSSQSFPVIHCINLWEFVVVLLLCFGFFPYQRETYFFFFSVSLSQVMVIKSDIINYLVHSSNVEDELGHKVEVYTMSKELPIYINLQTDNNFEHQSTEVLWYLMPCTFYCLVGLQSLNKQPLLSWKNGVLSNNGSLIRKRQNAWCHPEPSLQSSVSSDTRGWCVFNFKAVLEKLTTLDPSARALFVFYFLLLSIIIQLHWSKTSLYQSQCHLNRRSHYCESQLL